MISSCKYFWWTPTLIMSILLTARAWLAGGAPGEGDMIEVGGQAAPSRLIVGGTITRVTKPDGDKFTVSCYVPNARSAVFVRILKIDKASLILRRAEDGRFTKVDLADLYRDDMPDSFQACISPEPGSSDHAQLVYWLVVMSNGSDPPVPKSMME